MSKKILFADDDAHLMEVLLLRFKSAGYKTVDAYDGEEALLKMRAEKPDLIVMDITMPKMNGYTLVREMKADETLKDIPVIVLSGKDTMQDIFEIEGVGTYLVKPFGFDDLLGKVKEQLGEES
ncbi:MAG: response regulator [Candidatus Omnitrophica bacterium]|nr:response regulator [Candidatus Omnitrophota bacterium]